ncbi:hypothetical protein KEJ18_01520 [Candidatus Bathyarchaeota archaeon]|nr:hypothetical protein [Candidatus Bathyarchaeota archaeon]
MGQMMALKVDLKSIEGEGEFPCPSCGIIISPDDESEKTYKIVYVERFDDDIPKRVTIICKKCHKTIILEGFEPLKNE